MSLRVLSPQTQLEGYLCTPLFDLCGVVRVSTVCVRFPGCVRATCVLMRVCAAVRKGAVESVVLDLQGNVIYVVEL